MYGPNVEDPGNDTRIFPNMADWVLAICHVLGIH